MRAGFQRHARCRLRGQKLAPTLGFQLVFPSSTILPSRFTAQYRNVRSLRSIPMVRSGTSLVAVIFFFMAGLLFAPHRVRHQRAYRHWMGASPLIVSVCVGLLPVNVWPLSGLG